VVTLFIVVIHQATRGREGRQTLNKEARLAGRERPSRNWRQDTARPDAPAVDGRFVDE
jgi:hypothetical protein